MRLQRTRASFDRNDTGPSRVVSSPASFGRDRTNIVDAVHFEDTVWTPLVSRALFARIRHTPNTYWPNIRKPTSTLKMLVWQVRTCHPSVPIEAIRIFRSPTWTTQASRWSCSRAVLEATVENRRTVSEILQPARHHQHRLIPPPYQRVYLPCYNGTRWDGRGKWNRRNFRSGKMRKPPLTRLSRNDVSNKAEYPAKRIIRHIKTGENIRHVVGLSATNHETTPSNLHTTSSNTGYPNIGAAYIADGNQYICTTVDPRRTKRERKLLYEIQKYTAGTDQSR